MTPRQSSGKQKATTLIHHKLHERHAHCFRTCVMRARVRGSHGASFASIYGMRPRCTYSQRVARRYSQMEAFIPLRRATRWRHASSSASAVFKQYAFVCRERFDRILPSYQMLDDSLLIRPAVAPHTALTDRLFDALRVHVTLLMIPSMGCAERSGASRCALARPELQSRVGPTPKELTQSPGAAQFLEIGPLSVCARNLCAACLLSTESRVARSMRALSSCGGRRHP